uniref:Uncharacterized protein n=1 Tax=Anguilla anguilla TaxID=7936 RepID=A0A0E9RV92_ANGAN
MGCYSNSTDIQGSTVKINIDLKS